MHARENQRPARQRLDSFRWEWLPLVLVIVALALLVVFPQAMQGRLTSLQEEIEETIEPARDLLRELQFAGSLETGSARAFLVTGDRAYAADRLTAQEQRNGAMKRLLPLVGRIDPALVAEVDAIRAQLVEGDRLLDPVFEGRLPRQTYQANLDSHDSRFRDILERINTLDRELAGQVAERRASIADTRRVIRITRTVLVIFALIAVMQVARLANRYRDLAVRMRRHARQQSDLSASAQSFAEALNLHDAADAIVLGAVHASRSRSAYLEQRRPGDQVEIIAAAGDDVPAVGLRVPLSSSVTEATSNSRKPMIVNDVSSLFDGTYLRPGKNRSALLLPLHSERQSLGTLVLLRGPGQGRFIRDDVAQAGPLADLAAAALRRVMLLEARGVLLVREREARAESEERSAELERVTDSRSRLMRGFGHDVKNPLAAADGYLQLLERGKAEPLTSMQRGQVERARRSLRAALGLIEDLLRLARAETERAELECSTIDPRELVLGAADEYRAHADAAGLQLEVELPDEAPPVFTDPRRVRQILGNLLSNAVKYTDEGRITLSIESRGNGHGPGWLGIHVTDTGRGISSEQQRLLFQEFRRLDSGAGTTGAGIGLAISQRLARALGGELVAESTLGVGSTFTLWLPPRPEGRVISGQPERGTAEARTDTSV